MFGRFDLACVRAFFLEGSEEVVRKERGGYISTLKSLLTNKIEDVQMKGTVKARSFVFWPTLATHPATSLV